MDIFSLVIIFFVYLLFSGLFFEYIYKEGNLKGNGKYYALVGLCFLFWAFYQIVK